MIEIKVYNKFKDLTNAYEFIAIPSDELKVGVYFHYQEYDYLITSLPVYYTNNKDGTEFIEAVFKAVRLGRLF